ncbi:MAG: phosphatase PAP2 family protein [Eubacterium sp.]
MLSKISKKDCSILYAIKKNIRKPSLNKVMITVTKIGNGGAIWLFIGSLMLFSKKYKHYGRMLSATTLIDSFIVNFIFKNIIRRPRPFITYPEETLMIRKPIGYSFPSGHALTSFAATTILISANKAFGIGAVPLATIISFSRMYLFVHYPSDVLVGTLLGIGSGLVSCKIQDTSQR